MANPVIIPVTTAATYATYPDWMQSRFGLSYAVEKGASATGSYVVNYTLDDPNDLTWTPIWIADPTNGTAQTTTQGGFYSSPVRGLQFIFSAVGGTGGWRIVVLQGMSAR